MRCEVIQTAHGSAGVLSTLVMSALRVRAGGVQVQQDEAVDQKDAVETSLCVQTPTPLKASQQYSQQWKEGGHVQEEEQAYVGSRAG